MNTIAFTVTYILAVLIVYVSSWGPSETVTTVDGPYNFIFSNYYQSMSLDITLKNIPSRVTTISLIYSGQNVFDLRVSGETADILRVDNEIKNGQVTIPFLRSLGYYKRIWIDVELKTIEGLCTKTKVAEGRYTYSPNYWDYTMRKMVYWNTNWTYDSTSTCILPKTCEIVIDFHNQCEEKFSCDYNAKKYTCTLHHENLKYSQIYELYQSFNYEPFLYVYLYTYASNTKLIMELESFDNNTLVFVAKPKNNNDILVIGSNEIILTAKDVGEDKIVGTLNYSESTDIQFNCEEYLSQPKITPVFTILINTKENKIKALHEAQNTVKYRLNMEDNGFILCCMYYSSEWTADGEDLQITRIVANKTLLMYQPKEPVSHNSAKKFSCDYNATQCTCTFHHELENSQTYHLVHIYDNDPFIAVPLPTSATNTKLIMELEPFDNNTSVNVVQSKNKSDIAWFNEKILTAKDVVKDKIVSTWNYSESTVIQFNCEEYLSQPNIKMAFTVLINKKENKIKLLDKETKKNDKNTIKMEDDGSILCCMYYSGESTADGEDFQITRVVVNKTLLMYQPKESLSPKTENTANTKDLAMSSTQSNNNYIWMVYVLAAITGVSVLILVLYFFSKQGWFTKSRPVEETVELDNNTHQNQVLYADLDFVRNANQQSLDQNEESHYATIIGELHPH